nr:Mpo1-like protein [Candidatus Coxiella mudrowiae]
MELLAKQLPEYRLYHSQKANKIAHYIRIPAVILGFLIALSWISISVAIRWQH